jgi:hypothetical protein
VSNDDLGNLPPIGGNPLDGDLLEDMGQPAPTSPLMADAAASPQFADDAAAASPLFSGDAAPTSPLPDDEEATPVPADEEPEEPAEEKPGFLAKLAESNPYTVILVASLVALLIGILCLFLEWRSYNYDTKAKETRQSAAHMSVPLDSGAAGASRAVRA